MKTDNINKTISFNNFNYILLPNSTIYGYISKTIKIILEILMNILEYVINYGILIIHPQTEYYHKD